MASRAALIAGVIVVIALAAAAALVMGGEKTKPAETPPGTTSPAPSTPATPAETAAEAGAAGEKEIVLKVGLLVDESGPTSDVGRDYARGAEAAFKYFNEKGVYTKDGVRVRLEYVKRDYAYNPSKAVEFYREFRDRYGVIAVVGWGTADTEKLADQVAKDKVLYISASYSAKLVGKPFNFFPAPDYSTQACAAVKWMAEKKQDAKLALLYDHKVAYSKSPIPAIKAYAPEAGVEIVADVDLPLKATGADAERAIQQAVGSKPDFLWCGNTIHSCSLAAKALVKYGLEAAQVSNVWGFDERFPQMAGSGVEGKVAGVSPWIWPEYAKDKPGYREVYEAAKMMGIGEDRVNLRFMQGFINVWLLVKAIERTTSTELMEKKGEALKEALESSCQSDPIQLGDITPPMRFCPGKHLPFTSVYIVVYGEDGKFHFEGPVSPEGFDCVAATQG